MRNFILLVVLLLGANNFAKACEKNVIDDLVNIYSAQGVVTCKAYNNYEVRTKTKTCRIKIEKSDSESTESGWVLKPYILNSIDKCLE